MARALEHAANIVRSKLSADLRPMARELPKMQLVPVLGERALAAAGGAEAVFSGAWDALGADFLSWSAAARTDALAIASRMAASLSTAEQARLATALADSTEVAWQWLKSELDALATDRLFNPAVLDELGEAALSGSVPPGLLRQAVARAGGAAGLVVEDDGTWVVVGRGGKVPAGGIATGELIMGALTDNGLMVEGYRWVYGPALRARPFQPHADLDGVVFENFDDAVLANDTGWPPLAYYFPGDHPGCICDFEPVLIDLDTGDVKLDFLESETDDEA